MHTLSFLSIDDFRHYKQTSINIDDLSKDTIRKGLEKIIQQILVDTSLNQSHWFRKSLQNKKYYSGRIDTITFYLNYHGHFVLNNFDKYYVIAFAIDYNRFNVYSRDHEKELFDWGQNN